MIPPDWAPAVQRVMVYKWLPMFDQLLGNMWIMIAAGAILGWVRGGARPLVAACPLRRGVPDGVRPILSGAFAVHPFRPRSGLWLSTARETVPRRRLTLAGPEGGTHAVGRARRPVASGPAPGI